MRDRGGVRDAQNDAVAFLYHLHDRRLLELARVVELDFDKGNLNVWSEPVLAADDRLLLGQASLPRPVRHQHVEFGVADAVPEEVRSFVLELEAAEAQLR